MKKRKNNILLFAILVCCSLIFTACTESNSEPRYGDPYEQPLDSQIMLSVDTDEITTDETDVNQQIDKLYVHFLDVGQGDSILIELPNNETMLIDAAESEQTDKIINYIHNQGYDQLDYVIATHPHNDHIGGMSTIINNFTVNDFYMTTVTSTTATYENMINALNAKNTATHTIAANETILSTNDLLIEVVAPNTIENIDDMNNASIVIKLTYGNNVFLFTGDAEKQEEDSIWTNIKCDVIKIAHHGSDSSTTNNFLQKTNPSYAVISVGQDNAYNHPSDTILNRLTARNITTFRTDIDGDIIFTSDGKNITVESQKNIDMPTETTISNNETCYILNTRTMKIHYADCSSVQKIKDENKTYTDDYTTAILAGYEPCEICHPS